jgi:hypothetical protein
MWQARLASTPPVHHASATQTAPPTTAPGRDREVRAGEVREHERDPGEHRRERGPSLERGRELALEEPSPEQLLARHGQRDREEQRDPQREPALLAVHLERVPPEGAPPRHDHRSRCAWPRTTGRRSRARP